MVGLNKIWLYIYIYILVYGCFLTLYLHAYTLQEILTSHGNSADTHMPSHIVPYNIQAAIHNMQHR
jgi:hypothetical protein